jgi:hypothetical protein
MRSDIFARNGPFLLQMNDESKTQNQQPASPVAVLAFARELRLLATRVERDFQRRHVVSALSALTALKPIAGTLTDAALSEVWTDGAEDIEPTNSNDKRDNPLGYI